jgi:hypothetical protein
MTKIVFPKFIIFDGLPRKLMNNLLALFKVFLWSCLRSVPGPDHLWLHLLKGDTWQRNGGPSLALKLEFRFSESGLLWHLFFGQKFFVSWHYKKQVYCFSFVNSGIKATGKQSNFLSSHSFFPYHYLSTLMRHRIYLWSWRCHVEQPMEFLDSELLSFISYFYPSQHYRSTVI